MCFPAKLWSFKQEIICTLFWKKKRLMKMWLVLFFSLFDLSNGWKLLMPLSDLDYSQYRYKNPPKSTVLPPVITERAMHTPGPDAVAVWAARAIQVRWELQQGPRWSNPCAMPSRYQGHTGSYSYGQRWVWTGHPFSRQVCSSLNS